MYRLMVKYKQGWKTGIVVYQTKEQAHIRAEEMRSVGHVIKIVNAS